MAILLGTRYLSGALTTVDADLALTGAGSSDIITAPEARDGSDATMHTFIAPDDTGSGINGSGRCDVFGALDAAAPAGTIEFVRVRVRARKLVALGIGPTFDFFRFYLNGTRTLLGDSGAAFAELGLELATNPFTLAAWVASDFAVPTFGFTIEAASIDPTFSSVAQGDVSEFWLEIWGTVGAVVRVKSSYGDAIDKAMASGIVEG